MAYQAPQTACTNAPARKIFAPMFRARWQNMQNIVNDSGFYELIPEPYLTYYNAYVRQCLQWARGFVPALHKGDFFSLGMGYTVCDILTTETMGNGYRVETKTGLGKKKLDEWEDKNHLIEELYKCFWQTVSGGNSLLVLTPCDGDIYVSAYGLDRSIFKINRKNEVISCLLFNRFTAGETTYYAREHRETIDGQGYYLIELSKGQIVTSPTFSNNRLNTIPSAVLEDFKSVYGDIELNSWYEMPKGIDGVGVYNVKNKACAAALSDLPGYSDSSLQTALDILYSIDFNYTQAQVDMYKGKTIVLIPKQMRSAVINTRTEVVNGLSFSEAIKQPELKDDYYTEVMTPDGTPIQPKFIQPDLRGDEHRYIRDTDLQALASKVGLSASTLASHLGGVSQLRTATEIKSEQGTTEQTVKRKRMLASRPINAMLSAVARFYGFNEDVELTWTSFTANSTETNKELLTDYNAGLIPRQVYLKKRWVDLSDEEIDKWVTEIDEEMAKLKALNDEVDRKQAKPVE